MFKLLVIYPMDFEGADLTEYTERRFQTMGGLLAYLGSLSVRNVYRIIIEHDGGHNVGDTRSNRRATGLGPGGGPDAALQRPAGGRGVDQG